ncbi:hypothetical protein ABT236_36440 [Streptomyces sp. NPDC001523]|uniref:DUF6197 family protein n=1 Tax=Streptomyces sp. NPDC001523 TaxID=3154383 RepID=UPI00332C6737
MPHPTHAPPIPARTSAPPAELSLEARMAATDAAMTVRLEEAAVAYEVNTAHIDTEPLDLADVLAIPLTPTLQPPTPYATPVAALLQRAHQRMITGGWCAGSLTNDLGATCLWGSITKEAAGPDLEQAALGVLMDVIRRAFGAHIDSVPAFNDSCRDGRIPLRMLDRAATLADTRGL